MTMTKIILPGSYDFDTPVSQLINVSKRGLRGNDLNAFIKRAGAKMADTMMKMSLKPGEIPIHLIAIGATEFYGPNRNGDGFTEECCKRYHDTFVKHARWYRNHKNKDPKLSYGIIKESTYNETMHRLELIVALNGTKEAASRNGGLVADRELEKLASGKDDWGTSMACALAGTFVKLRRGFLPVEKILPGDEVLTHRGRYRTVTARMRRVKQQYAKIKIKYCGRQTLEFTPDHEFYVARFEDIPSSKEVSAIGRSWWFKKQHRSALAAHARWLPCGELKAGDFVLMPIDRGDNSSVLSKEEARTLGYYLAEGSMSSDGYPVFTVNKKDAFVDEARELVDPEVPVSYYQHSASDKAYNVVLWSKPVGALCTQHVGRGVRNKVISRLIMDATSDMKLEFMAAWFNGDGWQDVKGLHWSTCSKTLSIELQNLLASVGIPATVCRIDHTSDLPDRPRVGTDVEYVVNVSNRHSAIFAGRSKAETVPTCKEKTTSFITGDYLALPVAAVSVVEEEVEVYDLSVEDDESFTACGIAVHNCKVAYDVCSICGNKAKTKADYCIGLEDGGDCPGGGCRDNLCKVAEDGTITFVDNPHPLWFDISDVYRPADRIAYVMGSMKNKKTD